MKRAKLFLLFTRIVYLSLQDLVLLYISSVGPVLPLLPHTNSTIPNKSYSSNLSSAVEIRNRANIEKLQRFASPCPGILFDDKLASYV